MTESPQEIQRNPVTGSEDQFPTGNTKSPGNSEDPRGTGNTEEPGKKQRGQNSHRKYKGTRQEAPRTVSPQEVQRNLGRGSEHRLPQKVQRIWKEAASANSPTRNTNGPGKTQRAPMPHRKYKGIRQEAARTKFPQEIQRRPARGSKTPPGNTKTSGKRQRASNPHRKYKGTREEAARTNPHRKYKGIRQGTASTSPHRKFKGIRHEAAMTESPQGHTKEPGKRQ